MNKISLSQQISALRILITAAERRVPLKQSEVAYLRQRWEAATDTLSWFIENEDNIRSAMRRVKDERDACVNDRADVGGKSARRDESVS